MSFPMPLPALPRAERTLRLLAGAAALLALVGLLLAFQGVVREAVHQGELRHQATARHSAATWRCSALSSLRQRDDCLAALNAPPPQETPLPATPRLDTPAVAQLGSPR